MLTASAIVRQHVAATFNGVGAGSMLPVEANIYVAHAAIAYNLQVVVVVLVNVLHATFANLSCSLYLCLSVSLDGACAFESLWQQHLHLRCCCLINGNSNATFCMPFVAHTVCHITVTIATQYKKQLNNAKNKGR